MPARERWSRENPGTRRVSTALQWQGGGGEGRGFSYLLVSHMTYLAGSHVLRSWPEIRLSQDRSCKPRYTHTKRIPFCRNGSAINKHSFTIYNNSSSIYNKGSNTCNNSYTAFNSNSTTFYFPRALLPVQLVDFQKGLLIVSFSVARGHLGLEASAILYSSVPIADLDKSRCYLP